MCKTRSTAGNPDPKMHLITGKSGWRECEVSYMSQDTKLRIITVELSTSCPSIKNNLNKVTDQDFPCSGCLIPCVCTYLRGYWLQQELLGVQQFWKKKIYLFTLWEPHYRCSCISGLSHSYINTMRRTCTLHSQTLGWSVILKGKMWENCSQNLKIIKLMRK